MKVAAQYIVRVRSSWRVLYQTGNDEWFQMDTGAFGQRDMDIVPVTREEALKLIHDTHEKYEQEVIK